MSVAQRLRSKRSAAFLTEAVPPLAGLRGVAWRLALVECTSSARSRRDYRRRRTVYACAGPARARVPYDFLYSIVYPGGVSRYE